MLSSIFSAKIWINAISILGLLYSLYLMSLSNKKLLRGTNNNFIPFIFVLFVTLYIGTRPLWCYTDTQLYTTIFQLVQKGEWAKIPGDTTEPFFHFIEYLCIEMGTAHDWLLVIATFYVICMTVAVYRWMPHHFFLAIMFCFTAFSFFSYGTNGIRNGMATSIALLGLSFFCKNKLYTIIGFLLLILGMNTHKTIAIVIVAASATFFFKSTNRIITIWLVCIILGLLFQDTFKSLFIWLSDDGRMEYYLNMTIDNENFSDTGFRWDFILYSSAPILLGWYTIIKKGITDKTYQFLLHTYIFANCFWILINTAAYSNRFAYLSWFMYPILLAYPLCKFNIFKNQGTTTALIFIASIAFSYFV